MDKDLLRIVIIVIGLMVMSGMILFNILKQKKLQNKIDASKKNTSSKKIEVKDPFSFGPNDDDVEIVPLGSALDTDFSIDHTPKKKQEQAPQELPEQVSTTIEKTTIEQTLPIEEEIIEENTKLTIKQENTTNQNQQEESNYKIPETIVIHIYALEYDGFNGKTLAKAFKQFGFTYGSNKIYEHLDKNRRVNFSVSSMVEPGLFPKNEEEQKEFNCPGIAFYLQPYQLGDPVTVFDQFIETIDYLTTELDGVQLDHNREALSKKTIQLTRKTLVDEFK